jgi:endo-1,3(4)-beta-glucanase
MFGSLLPFLASIAVAGVLPSGSTNDTLFHAFDERGIFGPIATDSAAGIAGGLVTNNAPPLSSFFAGLQPPVCKPPLLDQNLQ